MLNSYKIIKLLKANKEKLSEKYAIKSIALFGSYARDEQKEDSDIDIMVEFTENIGIRFIDLADEIEKIVGLKIDLVSKNGVKSKYLKSIEKDLNYV